MGTRKGDMFDTWMKQQSDLVQATALAYAEREVMEASIRALDEVSPPTAQSTPSFCPHCPCIHNPGKEGLMFQIGLNEIQDKG